MADKLSVEKPLFAPLSFPPPDPEVVANEPLAMNVWRYIVLRYAAYVNILVIFVLSTLTFNLVRPRPSLPLMAHEYLPTPHA